MHKSDSHQCFLGLLWICPKGTREPHGTIETITIYTLLNEKWREKSSGSAFFLFSTLVRHRSQPSQLRDKWFPQSDFLQFSLKVKKNLCSEEWTPGTQEMKKTGDISFSACRLFNSGGQYFFALLRLFFFFSSSYEETSLRLIGFQLSSASTLF